MLLRRFFVLKSYSQVSMRRSTTNLKPECFELFWPRWRNQTPRHPTKLGREVHTIFTCCCRNLSDHGIAENESSISFDRVPRCTSIFFKTERLSGILEFHLGPTEKASGAHLPCLEVLPDLQSPCGCGLSDPETPGSFLA